MSSINEKLNIDLLKEKEEKEKKKKEKEKDREDKFVDNGDGLVITKFNK